MGIPASYLLHQSYPNPFDLGTTISFCLPSKSYVTLKVHDLIGGEIATFIHGEMIAGQYSQKWNSVNVPSGIYY